MGERDQLYAERVEITQEIESLFEEGNHMEGINRLVDFMRRPDVCEMARVGMTNKVVLLGFLPKTQDYLEEAEQILKEELNG